MENKFSFILGLGFIIIFLKVLFFGVIYVLEDN